MKNITNAYLVLSVADIKTLLRAAELEQHFRGEARETVTLVLDNLTVICEGEEFPQIASWSIAKSISEHITETSKYLETFRASRNASDMAQGVRDACGVPA